MKVLLINPGSKNGVITTVGWSMTADDIGAFPPISLMYLSASLKNVSECEVEILDASFEKLSLKDIKRQVKSYDPDLVGITSFTPTFYDVMQIAKGVKEVNPNIHITLGGAHVSAFPEETISKPEIDSLVLGEGENIFPRLVNALKEKKPLNSVEGLMIKAGDGFIQTGEPGYIEDIDSLPFPDFKALPYKKYFTAPGTGNPAGVICSSRGCPYNCTFCCKPYRTYRMRSAKNIIKEITLYYQNDVKEFFFFDDMFNITPKRVIDISKEILSSGMKIRWSFRGRVDSVTEEMLEISKKSGCKQIFFGVETATKEGLEAIKKGITIEQVKRAVQLVRRAGMESSTNWIIGFPHDKSKEDIEKLIKFVCKLNSNYAQFNVLIPYQGTELFEEGIKKRILDQDFWRNHVMDPTPGALVPIWDEHMTREELSAYIRKCYTRFYFRPSKIIQNLLVIKSLAQLKSKIRGFLILLGFGGHRKELNGK